MLTTEPLPLPGHSTTGAGLRAWGLAEGLRSRGFDVIIASPVYGDEPERTLSEVPEFSHVRQFRRDAIGAFIQAESPDIVVLQHWGLAAELPELSVPLAIDLAGPHLLERLYWGSNDPDGDVLEKITALRRADFLVCSGEFQKHYFYAFMEMAGFDLRREDPLPVIPFSVPPPNWEEKAYGLPVTRTAVASELTFVYGGTFLAWQNPEQPLIWLLDEMDNAQKGRLLFYGGPHPVADASAGKFASLAERLSKHPRVEMRGLKNFDELLKEYRSGTVALDLMAQNPERKLAFTTRTMIYLYCGLPVMYNHYSELSTIIQQQKCGWALDPRDERGFRELVCKVLNGNELDTMRDNALGVAFAYNWEKTIGPLADFCAAPFIREGKIAKLLSIEAQGHEMQKLKRERDEATQRLDIVQGKFINRLSRKLPALGILLAPFGYFAGWIVAAYLWFRFRPTCAQGPRPPK